MAPVADLIHHPKNPNQHSEGQLDFIRKVIEHQGWRSPLIISNLSGFVVCGNGRLMAARLMGLETVPVDRQDFANEADEIAHLLADNKIASMAELDNDILKGVLSELDTGAIDMDLTGFADAEIEELMTQFHVDEENDAEPKIDQSKELQKKWGTKLGQIWELGDHRIACGDSTSAGVVGQLMGRGLADCVFTSPPYGVGIDYGEYLDTFENLRELLPKLSAGWMGVVQDGGFAVVNFGDIISAGKIVGTDGPCEYPMALEYWPAFRASGWVLWSRRIWCKPAAGTGSMQCISSNRAATNWEHVWTWKKEGVPVVGSQISGEYASQKGWFDTIHDHHLEVGLDTHAAGMPRAVALRMLAIHSRTGAIVFEPFLGSGTTLIACENLGRKCRAIELAPEYVAVSIQRWVDVTGKEPQLVDG